MISDERLRELFDRVTGGASQPNPAVRYGKGTEIEDCVCEESCTCDPCSCDECEECTFCLCCCTCEEPEEDEDDNYDGSESEEE